MPLRISLKKALAILAVFSICFALQGRLGGLGILLATVTALSLSGLIVLVKRENLLRILWISFGAIVGALFGSALISPIVLGYVYGYDHGHGETAKSLLVGGIVGTLLGSIFGTVLHALDSWTINRIRNRKSD